MTTAAGSLNHLRLSVRDLSASEAFYDVLLGNLHYTKEIRADGVAWGRNDSSGTRQWLILTAADPGHPLPIQEPEAPGLHHLALNAPSRHVVDDIHASLTAREAHVLNAPAEYDYEPGYYAVFFSDPDGFKIEVVHSPASGGSDKACEQLPC